MPSSIALSQKKRLLLYLERFERFQTAWEVPYGVSQDGIGEALDILINNVSRTLSGMVEENLVVSRLAHVQGILRRRRVYFLSDLGRQEAALLKSNLDAALVPYNNPEGKTEELALSKVRDTISQIARRPVSVFDVMEYLRTRDVVSAQEFLKFVDKRMEVPKETEIPKVKLVHRISAMPSTQNFVGREKELEILRNWIKSKNKPIIVIQGIAGIGKTALAARFADECKDKKNLFWFRFHEWDSLRSLADELGQFLSESGRKQMTAKLRGKKSLEITEFGNLLMDEIQGLPALLFFDDTQKAASQMISFLGFIVERWNNPHDVGIIILSRELGKFYDSRDAHVRKVIFEIPLGGLDVEQSKQLLGPEFSEKSQEIYGFTKGHPLFLELIKSSERMEFSQDINTFLEHEILSGLDTQKKEILEKLSVFRNPVPIPHILGEEMDYALISSLSKKGLVEETQKNLLESHELIKGFIYNRLPFEKINMLHKNAVKYYLDLEESQREGGVEALYHLQKAGEIKRAVELAGTISYAIADLGLPEIRKLFSEFRVDTLSEQEYAGLLFIKGEILAHHDEWFEALKNYQECLRLNTQMQAPPEKLAELHNRIGEAQRNVKKWEETITSHSKALSIFEKVGDKRNLAKEHLSLGIVYKEMKNFQSASKHYEKSREILLDLQDKRGLAAVYNNLGMLNLEFGKFGKAKENFDEAMKLNSEMGDLISLAITRQNLGDLALVKQEYEEATYELKQSQDIFSAIGRTKEAQELALKLGNLYVEIDEPNKAIEAYKKGLDLESGAELEFPRKKRLFKKTEQAKEGYTKNTARLHSRIATVYRDMQMWDECYVQRARALEVFEKLGDTGSIPTELLEQGFDFEDSKKYDLAIMSLRRGLDLVKRVNDRHGEVAFFLNLARIYSKKADLHNAIRSSESALTLAEEIQDWIGANKACDILYELHNEQGNEKEKKIYSQKAKDIKKRMGKR
ncbi:MAG: tetratricopeptide repeat protein [Thermoplasmata archaeon]|nr:MAG: tetratricopeptide repeat protein [Thermoplasmata archaeon]